MKIVLVFSIVGALASMVPAGYEGVQLILQIGQEQGERKMARVAPARYEDLRDSLQQFKSQADSRFSLDMPIHYWMAKTWFEDRQRMFEKYYGETAYTRYPGDTSNSGLYFAREEIKDEWKKYESSALNRFTPAELADGKKQYERLMGNWYVPPIKLDYGPIKEAVKLGWLMAMACFLPFFLLKIARRCHGVWETVCAIFMETVTLRLPTALMFFPFMIAFYPLGDPRLRVYRAAKTLATAMVFCICYAPMAMANAAKAHHKKSKKEYSLVAKSAAPQKPEAQAPPVHVTVVTETVPAYIGLDARQFAGVCQQTEVAIIKGNTLVDVWHSASLDAPYSKTNAGHEVDVAVQQTFPLNKRSRVKAAAVWVNATPLGKLLSGDILQLRASYERDFTLRKLPVTAYATYRRFMPFNGHSPKPGDMLQVGATTSFGNDRVTFTVNPELLGDDGAFGFQRSVIARLYVAASWKIRQHVRFQFPMVRASGFLTHVTDGKNRLIVSGAMVFSW